MASSGKLSDITPGAFYMPLKRRAVMDNFPDERRSQTICFVYAHIRYKVNSTSKYNGLRANEIKKPDENCKVYTYRNNAQA
jgi:hypothetical protein